jgi:hypothetical protein
VVFSIWSVPRLYNESVISCYISPVWRWVRIPPLYHCESYDVKKMEPSAWGYNCATLFLEDINTETWPFRLGSLESETVKCGHESCRTWTWEWLCWWGPAAILNGRPILSSERMLHEGYDTSVQLGGILVVSLKWLVMTLLYLPPCAGGFECFHCISVGYRKRWKGNPVLRGTIGTPCTWRK